MIYLNNKELDNLHIGDKEIETVYYGDKEVWDNNAWYLLSVGTATSVNVRNFGYDPALLTVDNFIALSQNAHKSGYCEKVYSSTATSYVSYSFAKSFNQSTGIASFYYRTFSRNIDEATAMPLYILSHQKVPNARKIKDKNRIYLGWAQSFNVASKYADYQNLTANNFFLINGDRALFEDGPSVSGAGPVSGEGWVAKSYNASTGVLSFYNTTSPQMQRGSLGVVLVV